MVQDADGAIIEGGPPGLAGATAGASGQHQGDGGESGADEVRDGGFGWGSAAPLEGGRVPLGHPVKAWHDTQTHVLPDEPGYEGSDPDVWFTDTATAERAGFRHAH